MFGVVRDKLEDRHTSGGGQQDQATCKDSRARALVVAGYGRKRRVEERQPGKDEVNGK